MYPPAKKRCTPSMLFTNMLLRFGLHTSSPTPSLVQNPPIEQQSPILIASSTQQSPTTDQHTLIPVDQEQLSPDIEHFTPFDDQSPVPIDQEHLSPDIEQITPFDDQSPFPSITPSDQEHLSPDIEHITPIDLDIELPPEEVPFSEDLLHPDDVVIIGNDDIEDGEIFNPMDPYIETLHNAAVSPHSKRLFLHALGEHVVSSLNEHGHVSDADFIDVVKNKQHVETIRSDAEAELLDDSKIFKSYLHAKNMSNYVKFTFAWPEFNEQTSFLGNSDLSNILANA